MPENKGLSHFPERKIPSELKTEIFEKQNFFIHFCKESILFRTQSSSEFLYAKPPSINHMTTPDFLWFSTKNGAFSIRKHCQIQRMWKTVCKTCGILCITCGKHEQMCGKPQGGKG
jgi:hypothetical protein